MAVVGLGNGALGPKSLVLSLALAASLTRAGLGLVEAAVACLVFALVGSIGVGAPVAVAIGGGERAADALERWRAWLERWSGAISAAALLALGVLLVARGLGGLLS
jgi:threonine/homoserine/homoserine lactone efflux protein